MKIKLIITNEKNQEAVTIQDTLLMCLAQIELFLDRVYFQSNSLTTHAGFGQFYNCLVTTGRAHLLDLNERRQWDFQLCFIPFTNSPPLCISLDSQP